MKVSWDDEIPNIQKKKINVPNHQPVFDVFGAFNIFQPSQLTISDQPMESKVKRFSRLNMSMTGSCFSAKMEITWRPGRSLYGEKHRGVFTGWRPPVMVVGL